MRGDGEGVRQEAHAFGGGTIVQAVGDVTLHTGASVRTRYRHQVERIAPAVLVGREAELAELHAFCVDPATAGSYRWWQAAPWAGKSALMSSFVLSAPAGVRVVSFFVTARLAGQADRVAFVDNVLEQVLALLDEQLPPFLTPATREAQLLGLLEDAARLCAERGESLVLVIDGLDEDRGVTAGPDPHSIAGLLPVRLPEGMRVVVAGRADPPLPGDVHPDHPLRDPGVVRVLRASPRARLLREEMENELSRLLDDEGGGRELLGLLTAAGGGLTAADLAELVTQEPWRVGRRLRTVAGRSFTRRESRAAPGGGADVYLLGHEQLQVTALDMLGPALTAGYRERVHAWAEDYRARGWPRDTPEYLLHGYHTMLLGTGDLDRAAALCADRDRQRLLLATTGGDNAAHTQITTTLDALVERDPVDLTTIGRLAVHRDRLGDRNSRIPRGLAAVWARLGHDTRAATLAQSVIDPVERTRALVSVAAVSSEAGRQDVAAGLLDLALDSARSIAEPGTRDWALLWVSEESARAGNHHQAVEATRTITGTELRHRALVSVVELLSDVGRQDLADGLIDHALKVIGLITHPFWKGMAQVWAAKVLARSRRQDEADHLFDEAFREIRSLDRAHQEVALPLLAVSSVEAGDKSRAVEVVRLIAKSRSGSEALVRVAMALIKSGDPDRAVGLLGQAAEEARSIPHATARVRAWTSVAEALVEVGDHDRAAGLLAQAVETTQSIAEADARAETLVVVARAWVTMGAHDRAVGLLGQAVDQVRSVGDSKSRSTVLVAVAEALVGAGDRDRAVEVALSVADPGKRGEALVAVAGVLAETGVVEPAVELLTQAVEVTQSIPDPGQESRMSVAVAEVLSKDGDHDRAVAVARSIADPEERRSALALVARTLAEAGYHEQGADLARSLDRPHEVMLSVAEALTGADHRRREVDATDSPADARATAVAAELLLGIGRPDQAREGDRPAVDPDRHGLALITTARAMIGAGRTEDGITLLDRAVAVARSSPGGGWGSQVPAKAAEALAEVDLVDRAVEIVGSTGSPDSRSSVLMLLAKVLTRRGDMRRASGLAAAALQSGRWHGVVTELYAVSPSSALAIVDESITSTRR